ncbi:MAG: hypothetical protein HYZ53_02645 [Planctomycetes bacterium]|nr:hypothetical protein [Planctomycetota bacterium]
MFGRSLRFLHRLWLAGPALASAAMAVGCLAGGGRPPVDPKDLEPRSAFLRLHLEPLPGPNGEGEAPPLDLSLNRLRHRIAMAGMAHYTLELRSGAEVVLGAGATSVHEAERLRWLTTAAGVVELRVEANPKQVQESAYPSRAPPGFSWHAQRTLYGGPRADGERVLLADAPALAGGRVARAVVLPRDGAHDLVLFLEGNAAAALERASVEFRGRRLGILCDGKLLAAPYLTGRIADGRARLSADFTKEEASDLAALWNGGELRAHVTVEEFRVEKPTPPSAAALR